jgi:hypothetical protein
MANYEHTDEPESTFQRRRKQNPSIEELLAASAAAEPLDVVVEENIPFDANVIGEYIDYDELDEGDGFWKIIENMDYNETNTLAEDGSIQKHTEKSISKYQLIIKDTVHQQLFVNSGLLTELGRDYNCQINFRRNNGNYALFVRPNDTNYMINVTNGISTNSINGPENKERTFFNLSLKTDDSSRKLIKTEYMSEYNLDIDSIHHNYRVEGKPTTIKKNKINLNKKEKLFNPYLILNDFIKKFLKKDETISMDTSLEIIHSYISKLLKLALNPTDILSVQRISKMFETNDDKSANDTILNSIYKIHQAFLHKSLGYKTVEEIDYKVSYKELFKTNNKFTEMLAYRYSLFIHDFEFTKSSDGTYVYTDPFPFKLETPFTATDIYLHRFDRHFNYEYAMERYDIKTTEKLHRLADIVELTKSIMMNFISISKKIMSPSFISKDTTINVSRNGLLVKIPIKFQINNIYQGLIWNSASRIVWEKGFNIIKNLKQPAHFDGAINIDSLLQNPTLLKGFKIVGLNIDKIDVMFERALSPVDNLICYEIPYIGIVPIVQRFSKTRRPFKNIPVIDASDKLSLEDIRLEGIERNLIEGTIIRDDTMNRIYNEFFNQIREKPLETDNKKLELVELKLDDLEMFPELSNINPREIPGVVSIQTTESVQQHALTPQVRPVGQLSYPTIRPQPVAPSMIPMEPMAPIASIAPITPMSAAAVLKTQIPFGQEISKIVIDIRQFKKDILQPVENETRRTRGIRIKQTLRPLIAKLEEFRQKQLREFKQLKTAIPASVSRLEATLKEEGIIKKSRSEIKYDELVQSIDESRKLLIKLAVEIRDFEEKMNDEYRHHNSKELLKIQKQILEKMKMMVENKRMVEVTIPTSFKDRATDKKINDTLNKELKQAQRPILNTIKTLEEEKQKLQEQYMEEQRKFEEIRQAKVDTTARNIEKDLEKQEKDRLRMLEKDQEKVAETTELLADLKLRADKLKKILDDKLKTSSVLLQNYYKYAQSIITSAVKSYSDYKTTVEYFADARAKTDKQLTDELALKYKSSLEKANSDMQLFTEIEENLNKTPQEIQMIATIFNDKIEAENQTKRTTEDLDTAVSARTSRRQELLAQKEELERRKAAAKTTEGERIAAEKEAALKRETEGLTEKEVSVVVKRKEEFAIEAYNQFRRWTTINTTLNGEIKKFEDEKKALEKELAEIIKKKEDPKFTRLQPKDKKKILERENELKIKLPIVKSAIDKKNDEYIKFLLENEKLIRTNINIKDESLKAKLIEKIELYKTTGQSGVSVSEPPEGITVEEWAALNKYLKYKQKYLQLKKQLILINI